MPQGWIWNWTCYSVGNKPTSNYTQTIAITYNHISKYNNDIMTILKLCIFTLISIIKSSCDPFWLGGTACDLGRWSDAEGALAVETCRPCPIGHSGPWQAAESAEWCQRCSPGWDVISLPRIAGRTLNPLMKKKKRRRRISRMRMMMRMI